MQTGNIDPKCQVNYLKTLCRSMYDLQKVRIQMGNRLIKEGKAEEMTLTEFAEETLKKHAEEVSTAEKSFAKSIQKELKHYPIWKEYLLGVRGCGPLMGGVIISEIQDIKRFPTISKLWTYCGFGLKDNSIQKRTKGEKSNWNAYAKTKLFVLAECLIRSNNEKYRTLYDNYKHRLQNRRCTSHVGQKNLDDNGCTDGHRHAMSMRYMVKMFLMDLYLTWYRLEGIEPRPSYQEEYLGHKHGEM